MIARWRALVLCSLLLAALTQGACQVRGAPGPTRAHLPVVTGRPGPTPAAGRIVPADLAYLGAFRLPDSPHPPDDVGWEWGGSALAYTPLGDPSGAPDGYPGSLFGAGHDQTMYVSEVSIPAPVASAGKHLADLPTAATLQPFRDVRGGLYAGQWDEYDILRAGLAWLPAQGAQAEGQLYFCFAGHSPGNDTEDGPTHGWRSANLASGASAGIWRVGELPKYLTADYMGDIPTDWAAANTPGRLLATGRFRDGGQAAMGPALFAIGPWNEGYPPPNGATLGATPLLRYQNVLDESPATLAAYHHSDEWEGLAWLTADDRAAVVFVGTKGLGECWYGCADGTVWPDEPPYPPACPERGWWSTSFQGQMLFYDPADLARVALGTMQAWEPQPYATLNLDPWLYGVAGTQQKRHLGGVAFDRARGLLYVIEPLVDADKPIVHVWQVG